MICLFRWPEITSTIKYQIFTLGLISYNLSSNIFIVSFYSRWLVQYLCRLWRSHSGPVHTEGLPRPLLARRLPQGEDSGVVVFRMITLSCCSVPNVRCCWTRPTLALSEMGKLSVRKTTPGWYKIVSPNCWKMHHWLLLIIQFSDRKIWYLLMKKISLWQFEN